MAQPEGEQTPAFSVWAEVAATEVIVTLGGDISSEAEKQMTEAFAESESNKVPALRLRFLPGVTMTSSGIAVLITMTSRARKQRRRVVVEGLSPHYRKIFDMIGLSKFVTIEE